MFFRLKPALILLMIVMTISVSVAAQSVSNGDFRSPAAVSKEEYAVLTTIIARYYEQTDRPIVIEEYLSPCTDLSSVRRSIEGLIEQLRLAKMENDCILKPKQQFDFRRIKSGHRVTLIKEGQYARFFHEKGCEIGWKAFYARYPNSQGYAKFSRVGFDETEELAVVEFTYVRECLNGEGHLFLMRKTSNKWEVAKDELLWIF